MRLHGKTALIPGGSRPVGRAIARKLAEEGANLVLPYFDWPDSSREMIDEFTAKGTQFLPINVDLTREEQIEEMMVKIDNKFGSLHFLINNIERGGMPVIHGSYKHEHNRGQWDLEVNTTLKSKWLLFNYCLPLLRRADSGCVVNISSISA